MEVIYSGATQTLTSGRAAKAQGTKQGFLVNAPGGLYVNVSATGAVTTGPGYLQGVIVNSHASGTIKLWDNTSAATTVMFNTITLAAGERWIPFFGAKANTAIFLTLGGTADLTFIVN